LLANYLKPDALPTVPAQYFYAKNIGATAWGMMDNDKIGDCTCAAAGHLIMEWTDDNGALYTPADQDIVNAYAAITGYNPATGQNDNGASETSVLNYWRSTGISSHKNYGLCCTGTQEPQSYHVVCNFYSAAATSGWGFQFQRKSKRCGLCRREGRREKVHPVPGEVMQLWWSGTIAMV